MIDDDGSGTTGTIINNAWKTELYNQIDGLVGARVPWVPTDNSGANLIFPAPSGMYSVIGDTLCFWAAVVYPATADAATARIGGLPLPARTMHAGGYTTIAGINVTYHLPIDAAAFYILAASNGSAYTNAQLSGQQFIFQGTYLIR